MKTRLEYVGGFQAKGEYEVEEKTARELLKLPEWKLAKGESVDSKEELKPVEKTLRDTLEGMNMSELRVYAKTNNLESKDTDRLELIEELLQEING